MSKTVDHVVFFKLKEVSEEKEKELMEELNSLPSKIEGVQTLTFGRNITPERAQGYNYALRATFDSKEIIQKYAIHPEHVKVATKLKELFEAPPICLDWEY
ncbi:hypothetical protein C9374_001346 [Naegleria lovaniensis]|uniref:Stress-response A/B barrel domain-containing protein n=1 Tax=Naegleria lovaniensis TaxID=51637 RepID=A0AA88GVH3_NAELO|nr:uncharacterized protein C9374_001346 [Naegleria lovaniensis]KAG2387752.1 hypothetical protein C9374_001346 [Naegleria lovaniensis]